MKTTNKQFELFKKECRYWVDRFELSTLRFDFFLRPLPDGCQSRIQIDYMSCVATVFMDTTITKTSDDSYSKVIKEIAMHEIIHALLGNFAALARSRFVTAIELDKAEEELVTKLEGIIK